MTSLERATQLVGEQAIRIHELEEARYRLSDALRVWTRHWRQNPGEMPAEARESVNQVLADYGVSS